MERLRSIETNTAPLDGGACRSTCKKGRAISAAALRYSSQPALSAIRVPTPIADAMVALPLDAAVFGLMELATVAPFTFPVVAPIRLLTSVNRYAWRLDTHLGLDRSSRRQTRRAKSQARY
jgi:hypothetical protein